jgi:beta-N-acetylhexosaminidase
VAGSTAPLIRRIGQLFMIGFEGPEVTPDLRSWMKEYRPGGMILFSRNLVDAGQIAHLTNELQAVSADIPLIIAIDQEGGRVSRLPADFTIFPSAAAIACSGSTELAYQAAAVTARELRAVGINMNMAPVLDVHTNPANPIIGNRAFGTDPERVSLMGAATVAGLHDHLVLACGKHFPGHGDTSTDSHLELPLVSASRARMEEVELPPFRYAIEHGLEAIMTAHVHYPALDPKHPATLSPVILSGLLREEMNFSGLIFSDDLEMRAILDHSSAGDAAVRSLQAGVDIILICRSQTLETQALEAVRHAVESREIDPERLETSLSRLGAIKQKFAHPGASVVPSLTPKLVGIPAHRELLGKIQAQAQPFI